MKIQIKQDALCGSVLIPRGEYWVALQQERSEFTLSSGGKDLHIKALKRRSTAKQRTTTVQFFSGGGKTWSLVVSTPKAGEWVAFVEYQ